MSDENEDKKYPSAAEILKDWPVLDILDFEGVTVDVTEWEKDCYTATLNFHVQGEEPPFSGFSLCTQISGESIRELYQRVDMLLSVGLFDGVELSAHGTIWSADGDEIGEINWTDYADDFDEEDENTTTDDEVDTSPIPPTIH